MSAPKMLDAFLADCVSDCVESRPAEDVYPQGEVASIGATLATVYRDEAVEIALGHGIAYRTCECGRVIKSLEHDGQCRKCAGIEDDDDPARRREARRRLHRDTAMLLRRLGEHERAALHDADAERER